MEAYLISATNNQPTTLTRMKKLMAIDPVGCSQAIEDAGYVRALNKMAVHKIDAARLKQLASEKAKEQVFSEVERLVTTCTKAGCVEAVAPMLRSSKSLKQFSETARQELFMAEAFKTNQMEIK